jgi:hypothetical protein
MPAMAGKLIINSTMARQKLKLLLYSFGFILITIAAFYSWSLYGDWKYNQHYEKEVIFYCRHKFIGCANENIDFQVFKIEDANFSFLVNEMVSLRCPELEKGEIPDSVLTQDLMVQGVLYKNKFNIAVSPMYDCQLFAYRVDVKKYKIIHRKKTH